MERRRTVLVAISVVAGLIAAFAVVRYLATVDERAYDNAELVEVFVVKETIPRDFPAERAVAEGLIGEGEIPREFVPPTAVTDLQELAGTVALTELAPNQVIVSGQFVDPVVARRTFAQRIPDGNVAVTVSVDAVRGVAGLLVPGDRVNILVSDGDTQRVLYQNVLILAIGQTAAPEPGEQPPPEGAEEAGNAGLITFAVPPLAAQRIAFAAQQGNLYLTLVPPTFEPIPLPPVTPGNLFEGGLTPEDAR